MFAYIKLRIRFILNIVFATWFINNCGRNFKFLKTIGITQNPLPISKGFQSVQLSKFCILTVFCKETKKLSELTNLLTMKTIFKKWSVITTGSQPKFRSMLRDVRELCVQGNKRDPRISKSGQNVISRIESRSF